MVPLMVSVLVSVGLLREVGSRRILNKETSYMQCFPEMSEQWIIIYEGVRKIKGKGQRKVRCDILLEDCETDRCGYIVV